LDEALPDWLFELIDQADVCGGGQNRMSCFDPRYHCYVDPEKYCSERYVSERHNLGNKYFCSIPVWNDEIRKMREAEGKKFP